MNIPMNSKTFEGKVALVTGGNSGIGLATAMLLNRQGAKVIISGRDQNTLNEAAAAIGESTLALRSDVNVLADLDALFTFVEKHAGKIDVLFANAGVAKSQRGSLTTLRRSLSVIGSSPTVRGWSARMYS
jgi:NAD(P)-dependent dehydrogenase (short-subunit alcohol dehydrogenase family)